LKVNKIKNIGKNRLKFGIQPEVFKRRLNG